MVSLFGGSVTVLLRWRGFVVETVFGRGPQGVDVFLLSREFNSHYILAIFALDLGSTTKILRGTVITLRSPRDIVDI